jgi:biotin carboxyl carrier protein
MKYRVERAGTVFEVDVELQGNSCVVRGPDGQPQRIELSAQPDGSERAITPWGSFDVRSARRGAEIWADLAGHTVSARVERRRPSSAAGSNGVSLGALRAPMPGKLLRLDARVGDAVKAGQALAVIEAMKMENELVSPIDGVVTSVEVSAPSAVEKGALLLVVEPA